MRKLDLRIFYLLLAAMFCMAAFSMTTYAAESPKPTSTASPFPTAKVKADEEDEDAALTEFIKNLFPTLTPDGNLSLIDDLELTGMDEDGNRTSKQFITVQSKNGNYFYIVIDRAGDTDNVYFLNLVDEADLLALTKDGDPEPTPTAVCTCKDKCYAGHVDTTCPVCAVNMSECTGKEAKPEPSQVPDAPVPQEEPKRVNYAAVILVAVLFLVIIGGAVFYVLKVRGDKAKAKGSADPDDMDFPVDEEDEYADLEPSAPKDGDGTGGDLEEDD